MSIIKKLLVLTISLSIIVASLFLFKVNKAAIDTDKSILEICDFTSYNRNSENCLKLVIKYAIDNNAYSQLVKELDIAEATYTDFFGFCHTVTHELGSYAVKKYSDIDTLLTDTTYNTCGGGLSHGALVSYLAQPNMGEDKIYSLIQACINSVNSPTCSHGIGHAFASRKNIDNAINDCLSSSLTYSNRNKSKSVIGFSHSCNYGVMMENFAPFGSISEDFFIKDKNQAADICENFYNENFTDKYLEDNPLLISLFNGCSSGLGFSYGAEIIAKLMGGNIDIDNYAHTHEYIDNCTRLSNIGAGYNIKFKPESFDSSKEVIYDEEVYMYIYGCQIQTLLNVTTYLFKDLDSIDDSTAKVIVKKYKDLCSNFANQLDDKKLDTALRDFYGTIEFNKACEIAALQNKSQFIQDRYLRLDNLL